MIQHYCYCSNNPKGFYLTNEEKQKYCCVCYGLLKEKEMNELGGIPIMPLDNITDETNPKDKIGAKKPRLSLVPPSGVVYAALAMANGADKYGPYNWRDKKVQAMIYLEACMRHLWSWQDGEENAQDSGIPHLGHAIACLLILIDAKETNNLIDNRPKAGAMAAMIEKFTKKS